MNLPFIGNIVSFHCNLCIGNRLWSIIPLHFEWDENKPNSNIKKHGISFDEASEAFSDFSACIFDDVKHSDIENRELLIGYTESGRLIIVRFTFRKDKIRRLN